MQLSEQVEHNDSVNPLHNNVIEGYVRLRDYLQDRMALLSLKLHREVIVFRAQRGEGRQETFLGLFISDDDINFILAELQGQLTCEASVGEPLSARIAALEAVIEERKRLSDLLFPEDQLARIFHLHACEIEMLFLCLAAEIDERFSRVYGFLHDDVNKKNMSGALAEKLCGSTHSGEVARRALQSEAPLRRYQLLHLMLGEGIPLMQRGIKLDDRVVNYLLGVHDANYEFSKFYTEPLEAPYFEHLCFESRNRESTPPPLDDCLREAEELALSWEKSPKPITLSHTGQEDVEVFLQRFCGELGLGLIRVEWKALFATDATNVTNVLAQLIREAFLTQSVLYIPLGNAVLPTPMQNYLKALASPLLCLSSIENKQDFLSLAFHCQVPNLSLNNRLACWHSVLNTRFRDETISQYADDIRQGAERYPMAMLTLANMLNNRSHAIEDIPALLEICRERVSQPMQHIAQRIKTPFSFDDIVLNNATTHALRSIVSRRKQVNTVLKEWRLTEIFSQSEGCSALFAGPSGTGKTMAAGVIANALGLAMYRVELSGVVSKYIGETEKNLEKVFQAAAASEVVLFIDEADALFGKRSDVKDAHDRYANIETSYLLQKMEEHRGLVILATNYAQNIDDAFYRRFTSVVEFRLPAADERKRLWQKLFLLKAPLDENLDIDFLADRFELSGGHIKNCILVAAYDAAERHASINMPMLIRAISREYFKIGKPVNRQHFGEYYSDIRKESMGGFRQ